jgi:hypothetical protein
MSPRSTRRCRRSSHNHLRSRSCSRFHSRACLIPSPFGRGERNNKCFVAWSAARWPSGVRGAGVWTLSWRNMVATSEAEEDAVTGRGLKTGALVLRGCMVVKSTMGMGIVTGVLMGCSCENGTGESAMAPAGYSAARSLWPSEDM